MKLDPVHTQMHRWHLYKKRVLVRADLNTPHTDVPLSEYKMEQLVPTLDYLRDQGAFTTLITHNGRPSAPDATHSNKFLMEWFTQKNYRFHFCITVQQAYAQKIKPGEFILLENLRFFSGERERIALFAEQLSRLGDYFIQDAFAALHEPDASITLPPHYFSQENRSVGFLVERELKALEKIIANISHPYCAYIGGKKVATKLSYLDELVNQVDELVLLPALSFTFAQARGESVGKSYVDIQSLERCRQVEEMARKIPQKLIMPIDYYVTPNKITNCINLAPSSSISNDEVGIMCGPKSIELFASLCRKAHTILVNGLMGFADRPATLASMKEIITMVRSSHAQTIIGGGDTVMVVEQLGMLNSFTHVSTGGGALLAVMSGTPLVGLESFKDTKKVDKN